MTRRIWAILLALAMCVAAFPMQMAFAETTRTTRCNLKLRKKASATSDSLLTIPGGTELPVYGTSGGWTKTSYNGHEGYVSTNYLMDLTRSGYYPLKEGDESPYVRAVQEQLIKLGYMTGSADGKYGESTTAAVKAFQSQNGISADGQAGGETQRTLFGDSAKGSTTTNTTVVSTTEVDTGTTTTTAASASSTVLRKGDRGDEVKALQARLIELGYLTDKADGVFGTATEKAVKAFQTASKLSSDGKAGKVTQSLLFSSSAKKADGTIAGSNTTESTTETTVVDTPSSYATLKRGMTSDDVKKLQLRLKELGYMTANATGFYGTATQTAVELFQRENGLATDGVAGKSTLTKVFSTDALKAGSVSGSGTTSSAAANYGTLKEGMKSSAVTTMQKKLKELGYMTANATGYFGSATRTAVVAFQKKNGLTADGVAGKATLTKMYDGAPLAAGSTSSSGSGDSGSKISGPSKSQVKLLHWQNNIKPSLKNGAILQVYDPATGYGWQLKALSLGRHLDAEPNTAADTASLHAAFGNKTTWTPKIVYVKLPSGTWTMATTHNTPHLSGNTKDNNFDGHLCVHFLRDMAEAEKNDPKYGVQNQKVLREGWKSLTGATVN